VENLRRVWKTLLIVWKTYIYQAFLGVNNYSCLWKVFLKACQVLFTKNVAFCVLHKNHKKGFFVGRLTTPSGRSDG
jgi:hypothetical protein